MDFGQVEHPETVDFQIPSDHPDTVKVLQRDSSSSGFEIYVGCAKWNRNDFKNFYPKSAKDDLEYYSKQFNCIELNATFYGLPGTSRFDEWYATVPANFRFFPKLEQEVSHGSELRNVKELVERNVAHMSHLQEKLGMVFLQMPESFGPKDFDRVAAFAENWTFDVPLAIEFRHTAWYNDSAVSSKYYDLLEAHRITNILVDTAGRRDLLHMRLTTPTAFIRWVGTNQSESDRSRLDAWIERISAWKASGLRKLLFFVHEHGKRQSPALAAYFIERLNKKIGTALRVPKTLETRTLFEM